METLFSGFDDFGRIFGGMLLMAVYVILWSILLLVPGIVKFYSYAMTPYLLHDNPAMGAEAAVCRSMKMMRGKKMKLFLLDLSFIVWILLAILTFGIGYFWLYPYMYTSHAAFYEDIREITS